MFNNFLDSLDIASNPPAQQHNAMINVNNAGYQNRTKSGTNHGQKLQA